MTYALVSLSVVALVAAALLPHYHRVAIREVQVYCVRRALALHPIQTSVSAPPGDGHTTPRAGTPDPALGVARQIARVRVEVST